MSSVQATGEECGASLIFIFFLTVTAHLSGNERYLQCRSGENKFTKKQESWDVTLPSGPFTALAVCVTEISGEPTLYLWH